MPVTQLLPQRDQYEGRRRELGRMTHTMTRAPATGRPLRSPGFRYQLERCADAATIYIGGSRCAQEDVAHLADLVTQLPPGVRTLRVDMHAMEGVPLEILMSLRNVLSEWRELRRGNVRLVFAVKRTGGSA